MFPSLWLSPLGGFPHSVAVVSVEVSRHLTHLVQAASLDVVWEAQSPEGEGLHGTLDQLDVATTSCCVCLKNRAEEKMTLRWP